MIDKEKLRQILNEAEGRRAKARSVVDGEEVPSDRERRRKILEEAGLIKPRDKEATAPIFSPSLVGDEKKGTIPPYGDKRVDEGAELPSSGRRKMEPILTQEEVEALEEAFRKQDESVDVADEDVEVIEDVGGDTELIEPPLLPKDAKIQQPEPEPLSPAAGNEELFPSERRTMEPILTPEEIQALEDALRGRG